MTNTLTDRERELVEAARTVAKRLKDMGMLDTLAKLSEPLCAYDPPKVRQYRLPSWEEVTSLQCEVYGAEVNEWRVREELMACYGAIREAFGYHDFPKVKKYTVPDWERAPADGAGGGHGQTPSKLIAGIWYTEASWNSLREALATEE